MVSYHSAVINHGGDGMRKMFWVGVLVLAGLFGCSTMQQYGTYRSDMWKGKKLLDEGEYKQALDKFVKASGTVPTESQAYAFAATASYKLNDVGDASRYIGEAARLDKGSEAHIRILGYKALVLLKEDKQKEGLQALSDYIGAYSKEYAPQNVREVRGMWRSSRIDLPALQQLIDEEISVYESDMDQYRTSGTGWFAAKYGQSVPISR